MRAKIIPQNLADVIVQIEELIHQNDQHTVRETAQESHFSSQSKQNTRPYTQSEGKGRPCDHRAHVRSEVVQSKPEDLVGANPRTAVMFQQKGLLEAQHLVFVGLTHKKTRAQTRCSSEIIPHLHVFSGILFIFLSNLRKRRIMDDEA